MTNQLDAWVARFEAHNECPWPGPRPLLDLRRDRRSLPPSALEAELEDAKRQLRGRGRKISEIANVCLANDLVVVHGQSGVGKSSILNVGLIPKLEALGKTVIMHRDWGVNGRPSPSTFIMQSAIDDDRNFSHVTHDPFADLEGLDRDFPNQLVIVMDQFEELIRSNPTFAQDILQWIENAAGRSSAKFVISLRSEYEYQLRDLHTQPFTKRERIEVPQITDESTIRMIIAGDHRKKNDVMPITDGATERLWALWEDARETNSWNRPGLLHLQATLYVLWMGPNPHSGGRTRRQITEEDVDDLVRAHQTSRRRRSADPQDDHSLFSFGLERSVSASIRNCEAACTDDHSTDVPVPSPAHLVPRAIADQTRWIFRDITEHLASGGYKTQMDVWDLAHKVLAFIDEPLLRTTPTWGHDLFNDEDWLGAPASSYVDTTTQRSPFASGPAAALGSEQLLFELYRCFFFALEWMRQSNIVQILPSGSSYRVTLTHDRFSEGLNAWREDLQTTFREATGRYVAYRGKADLSWPDIDADLAQDRVIANVRWKQCIIEDTAFRAVTFVNCDFSGSNFERCTFDGATFVNCTLDDVDFVGCTISGAPTWRFSPADWDAVGRHERRPKVEDPPEFRLAIGAALNDMVALTGRPLPDGTAWLLSPTSGQVARPVPADPEQDGIDEEVMPEIPSAAGGLVMCGGRLSSLTFRDCTFEEEAVVALRHIAGTSLEICDQTHGTFDIFAAAIRGLAVTLPVNVGEAPRAGGFTFDFRHAKIINTWFGVGLTGRASFHECNVWQLINASTAGFDVNVTSSPYFGLINTGPVLDHDSPPLGLPPNSDQVRAHFSEGSVNRLAVESLEQVSRNIDFQES